MLMLITYDISFDDPNGQARLRRIAKHCLDYGVRAQYSGFECDVKPDQWVMLKNKLLETYDSTCDSLRFYHLGSKCLIKWSIMGQNRQWMYLKTCLSFSSLTCCSHQNPDGIAILIFFNNLDELIYLYNGGMVVILTKLLIIKSVSEIQCLIR